MALNKLNISFRLIHQNENVFWTSERSGESSMRKFNEKKEMKRIERTLNRHKERSTDRIMMIIGSDTFIKTIG
jgi:hypothetical protein